MDEPVVSLKEQKKYICLNISELTLKNKMDIYVFLKTKIPNEDYLIQNADGVRLNLELVNENIVFELYNLIKYKLIG